MIKLSVELSDANHCRLQQPIFVESPCELGAAVKEAVEDLMEACGGEIELPLVVEVHAAPEDGMLTMRCEHVARS